MIDIVYWIFSYSHVHLFGGISKIAKIIGVEKSTISRELQRNRGLRGYRPKQAQGKAMSRRSRDRKRIKAETWGWVTEKIREDWSPEQIKLWMEVNRETRISHEWIYQYIYADKKAGGDLHQHLRGQKKRRKRRDDSYRSVCAVENGRCRNRPYCPTI